MKFSLPGFKKSSSREEDVQEADKALPGPVIDDDDGAIRPVSLARTRLRILAAALVLMALLALFVFQLMSVYITRGVLQLQHEPAGQGPGHCAAADGR